MLMRTDPLTDKGKIDVNFFGSEEYKDEQKSLMNYLILEGFDSKIDNFVIEFRGRKWQVNFVPKSK